MWSIYQHQSIVWDGLSLSETEMWTFEVSVQFTETITHFNTEIWVVVLHCIFKLTSFIIQIMLY